MVSKAHERAHQKRELRLEKMRNQIASGDLTVRQMTADERARWDEHSAVSERRATPAERVRRDSARRQRARVAEARRKRPNDAS